MTVACGRTSSEKGDFSDQLCKFCPVTVLLQYTVVAQVVPAGYSSSYAVTTTHSLRSRTGRCFKAAWQSGTRQMCDDTRTKRSRACAVAVARRRCERERTHPSTHHSLTHTRTARATAPHPCAHAQNRGWYYGSSNDTRWNHDESWRYEAGVARMHE